MTRFRTLIVAAFRDAVGDKPLRLATALGIAVAVVVTYGIWLDWEWKAMIGWKALEGYINPAPDDTTGKKDAVQVYAVIVAGVIASITAAVGLLNLRLTRKNLEQQRVLETQRAQGTALQAYYEQIGKLLTEYDLRTTEREDIRELARGQTLTVLHEVDGIGKGSLITFLHGAGLIRWTENPAVTLTGADLQGADLRGAYLQGAYLPGADFRETKLQEARLLGASLQGADLRGADLQRASLQRAYLQGASLQDAKLQYAKLQEARLQGASLQGANLRDAYLYRANLQGAILRRAILQGASLEGARLQEADLRLAKLQEARLQGAKLQEAILQGASLHQGNILHQGASLQGANLYFADLRGAEVTDEQLADAWSLEGATMPDGQKYEDWLKDKKAREEGG